MLKMIMLILILFLLLETQNYMFLLPLYQQKIIKNYQNFLTKDLKDQFIRMSIKQNENKNMTNEYRYFLKSSFVGVNRFFVLIYLNKDDDVKQFKALRYLSKHIIRNYIVIISGKNFYDQPIASDVKSYKEIRKLTTG